MPKFNDAKYASYNRSFKPKRMVFNPEDGELQGTYGAYDVLNIKDFNGVKADDNDQTIGITAAITQALTERVGTVLVPADGEFNVNEIIIPEQLFDEDGFRSLEIVGNGNHAGLFGTVSTVPVTNKGSILKSFATGSNKAIIKVSPTEIAHAGGNGSNIKLTVRDLHIRSYDNPQTSAIDAGYATQFSAYNVFIDNGIFSTDSTVPTLNTATGIILPYINNGAKNILHNVDIAGYFRGLRVNEHTYGDYLSFAHCVTGMTFNAANQSSYFNRVGMYDIIAPVVVEGACKFSIQQMQMEKDAGAFATEADIIDVDNLAEGEITWSISNEGVPGIAASNFIKDGGKNVLCGPVGGMWHWTTAGRPTGPRPKMGLNTTTGNLEYFDGTSWFVVGKTAL